MNPNHTTNTQAFLKIVHPTYAISTMFGTPFVKGDPKVRRFAHADRVREQASHRKEVERLQAASKKWPLWLRGGRGLSEAEMDACKTLALMAPEERTYVLSIRFPDA